MTMRTPETEEKYRKAREDGTLKPLREEAKLAGAPEFRCWTVIDNRFPHDRHHVRNHLVVLKWDIEIERVSMTALEELWKEVMPWADRQGYDYIKVNLSNVRSIKGTPHVHLMELMPEYK